MGNENKNIILVAYDFTGIGDIAIENAAQMAKLLNYNVFLLHVINKSSKKNLKKANQTLDNLRARLKKISEDVSAQYSLTVEYDARNGSIFKIIADVCREKDAGFLVFGTHGKKGIQFIAGSFAMKLIKSCPSPVIVVQKPAQNNAFREVVFPLDIEAGSKQKVKWAISHHKQFNSKLHLLIEQYSDEYNQKRVNADLNQVRMILEKHNIPYTENTAPTKGNFAHHCVEFAKKINADMIMVATDPDKITFSPLGSPDERLIYNQHKIPVMCINAQDLKVIIGGL